MPTKPPAKPKAKKNKSVDSNELGTRVKRYAKVSSSMATLGAKLAGEKFLGIKIDKASHAADLRNALGGLKGPLMKVAQILSTIPDALPKEYVNELATLQADAPSMGWPFVKRRMMAELGADWQDKFKDFSREAVSAASLGQVHRATSLDGQQLACKLQYPDMQAAVSADLKQLSLFFKVFEAYDRAVDTKLIQQELADRLKEELDYVREAKHINLYRHMLGDIKTIAVPEVIPELSTERLLTMQWLDGVRLADIENRSQEERNKVALNMFTAWYVPFYSYGVIHGDPHLGNYTFQKDLTLNLLDYGCVRIFPPELVAGVITLYRALLNNDHEMAVEAYKAWGFTNPSKALIEALNIWARFIYAPLLEDKARLIEETNTGQYGRQTANRVHVELRKIGGVTIPREFVFMDRAAVGLGSVFLRLKAKVNWYRQFNELVGDFDVATLAKRQSAALKKAGL